MSKRLSKNIIISWMWIIIAVTLSWCWAQKTNWSVRWWTTIENVNKTSTATNITADTQLSKQPSRKKENKESTKKINKKKSLDTAKPAKNSFKDQMIKSLSKIKKEGITSGNISDINNLYYNKEILSAKKQKEIDKIYDNVKQKIAEKALASLKQTKKLDNKEKQAVLNILKNELKDKKSNINDLTSLKTQIQQLNRTNNDKKSIIRHKEIIIQQIDKSLNSNFQQKVKRISKEIDLSKITFKTTINPVIDNTKILKVIKDKIIREKKSLTNLKSNLTLQDFYKITNLAKSKSNIKMVTQKIINKDFIWIINEPYILYKWKKISINWLDQTIKTVNILTSVWMKKIPLMLTEYNNSWVYNVYLSQSKESYNLINNIKLYKIIKAIPNISSIVAKIYNIKTDDTNFLLQKMSDLINWTFIDYTNVKDTATFSELVNKLNNIMH